MSAFAQWTLPDVKGSDLVPGDTCYIYNKEAGAFLRGIGSGAPYWGTRAGVSAEGAVKYVIKQALAENVEARTELTADDNIHLMPSRKNMTFNIAGNEITVKPYWVARGNRVETPEVFNASSSVAVSAGSLNFYDTATARHWAFIPADQVQEFATGITEVTTSETIEGDQVKGYYNV